MSSLTLRDPDRGHFDPHGGVRDLRSSSRRTVSWRTSLSSGCSGRKGIVVATAVDVDVVVDDVVDVVVIVVSLARSKNRASPSGLLDHIRGNEMRKEEATSARRQQNNRTKYPSTVVVTLPPSSLSPRPRVFTPRVRVHPISRLSYDTCPLFSPFLSRGHCVCPVL